MVNIKDGIKAILFLGIPLLIVYITIFGYLQPSTFWEKLVSGLLSPLMYFGLIWLEIKIIG